jgi:hypothetical protein
VLGAFPELAAQVERLRWKAPLEASGFAEPRDRAFLEAIGCGDLAASLKKFWPARGPVWDALAVDERGSGRAVVLVESKSHPNEIYGSGCKAGETSRPRIEAAVRAVQRRLGLAENPSRWLDPLRPNEPGHSAVYQSANRYAHLYWLRDQGVDACLVHVLFIEDPTYGGTTRKEWEEALPRVEDDLGLRGRADPLGGSCLSAGARSGGRA